MRADWKVRNVTARSSVGWIDVGVFAALESLAVCAVVFNALLLVVIARFRYVEKPSFNLIASMAAADIGNTSSGPSSGTG